MFTWFFSCTTATSGELELNEKISSHTLTKRCCWRTKTGHDAQRRVVPALIRSSSTLCSTPRLSPNNTRVRLVVNVILDRPRTIHSQCCWFAGDARQIQHSFAQYANALSIFGVSGMLSLPELDAKCDTHRGPTRPDSTSGEFLRAVFSYLSSCKRKAFLPCAREHTSKLLTDRP